MGVLKGDTRTLDYRSVDELQDASPGVESSWVSRPSMASANPAEYLRPVKYPI